MQRHFNNATATFCGDSCFTDDVCCRSSLVATEQTATFNQFKALSDYGGGIFGPRSVDLPYHLASCSAGDRTFCAYRQEFRHHLFFNVQNFRFKNVAMRAFKERKCNTICVIISIRVAGRGESPA